MEIIAVRSKNHKVPSDTQILGYFSNKEKAIDFCNKQWLKINPKNLTGLLPKNKAIGEYYERFEYNSYYGNYPCVYELVPIIVQ